MTLPHKDDPSEYSSIVYNRTYYRTAEMSTRQDRGTLHLLRHSSRIADHCDVGKVTIDMLPGEILLEVFAFRMGGVDDNYYEWETLAHVCRRWRSIVFAAPRRLNLRLCTARTPTSKMLDIWPALPIAVYLPGKNDEINDNVLNALWKNDRVCKVNVNNVSDDDLEELVRVMQVAFPALTDLDLHSYEDAFLPGSFLDGSAPNLRSLRLVHVAFPALPKLLLSCPGLVSLSLLGISDSGYISSDAMVDCLSSLTRLETLEIDFLYSQPRPNQASRRPPPPTRTVFPVLSKLQLEGVTEYLEQILAHIEAPILDSVDIRFFDPLVFDVSRIAPCIGRTGTFETFDQAYMHFDRHHYIDVVLSSRNGTTGGKLLNLSLQWEDSGWKLLKLIRGGFGPRFEPFCLCDVDRRSHLPSWAEGMGNGPWLHLLRLFAATECMYLTKRLAVRVAPALQELTGAGVKEVLPVLQNIFVECLDSLGPVQEALGQFVAQRQLISGHTVDVQCWVKGERT